MRSSHCGGDEMLNETSDLTRAVMFSALLKMVRIVSVTGTRTMSRIATVIIATASPRFFATIASSLSRIGHVAITITAAQIIEITKGRMIQKLAAMSTPMKSTERVVWVMSRGMGNLARIWRSLLFFSQVQDGYQS